MGSVEETYVERPTQSSGTSPAHGIRPPASLSRKYSQFTGIVLSWMAVLVIAWDFYRGEADVVKIVVLAAFVPALAYGLSRFTHHLMAAPLRRLQEGIQSVEDGRLEPIQVSRTGDEIEYLGHQFNRMIARLQASEAEVREHRQMLEERIRQRTEALEEATHRAMAANRAKSEFLANISHELRTPMNGVLGMLDIVLDDGVPEPQREQLEIAKGCANSLLALLNDLLDLSKIEAGKMILEQIAFDVRIVAEDCTRAMQAKAREKRLELRFMSDPAVPERVLGDPLRFRQIVTNLLSNAVKFTDKGRVEVTLGVNSTGDSPRLCLAVRDTGMGIPPGKLNDIFEDFTQADGSVSRRYGGTGLGLAITRRLVQMHGGAINVQSRVNQGSVFQVELPLALPARAVAAGVAGSDGSNAGVDQTASPGAEFPAAGMRVLVVEDNLVNQRVIASVLTKQGFEVEVAANGREALSAMNRKAAQIVLMDVQMPEIDGITAARLIRENAAWRHVPIIALTAHAMQGDRERCLQAGMNDYLAKPSPPAAVLDCVRRHLLLAREAAAAEAATPSVVVPSRTILPRSATAAKREESLETGMRRLFVRLAPERLEALKAAAERLDPRAIEEQAKRLASAAAGIDAHEAARCARELARDAALGDQAIIWAAFSRLQREMLRLDDELQALASPSSPR
ncbi:MAG: response regulator [Bryobacterales bacterium]|nr:response regulator [Bryobacterales bacterium]